MFVVVFRIIIIYFDINVRCANILYNSPALFCLSLFLVSSGLMAFYIHVNFMNLQHKKYYAHFRMRIDPSMSQSIVLWNLNRAMSVCFYCPQMSCSVRYVCRLLRIGASVDRPQHINCKHISIVERCKCEMIEQNLWLSPKNCILMGAAH